MMAHSFKREQSSTGVYRNVCHSVQTTMMLRLQDATSYDLTDQLATPTSAVDDDYSSDNSTASVIATDHTQPPRLTGSQ